MILAGKHIHRFFYLRSSLIVKRRTSDNASAGVVGAFPTEHSQALISTVNEFQAQGLGAGSIWNPVSHLENGFNFLHSTIGMPWWASIVSLTFIMRVFIFPINIKQMQCAANISKHAPKVEELKAIATKPGATHESRVALFTFMRDNNCSPFRAMSLSLIPIPLFMSMFLALREMANAGLTSFKSGGLFWFTNLSIPDPFYLLPLSSSIAMLALFELNRVATIGDGMKWLMRVVSFVSFPIISTFPAALTLYFACANFISLFVGGLWKIPLVRKIFKIPPRVIPERPVAAATNKMIKF